MITNEVPITINVDTDFSLAIKTAKEIFFSDGVFVYPTDTIYGFGGNPFSGKVIKRIINIKRRNENKQFIYLIKNPESIIEYVELNKDSLLEFLKAVWPNPITIIFNLKEKYFEQFNSATAAFRMPNDKFCLSLLSELNCPLISTSVNRSENPPINNKSAIIKEFKTEIDAILFTNKRQNSKPSTIISLTSSEPVLIRQGSVKFKEILTKNL